MMISNGSCTLGLDNLEDRGDQPLAAGPKHPLSTQEWVSKAGLRTFQQADNPPMVHSQGQWHLLFARCLETG